MGKGVENCTSFAPTSANKRRRSKVPSLKKRFVNVVCCKGFAKTAESSGELSEIIEISPDFTKLVGKMTTNTNSDIDVDNNRQRTFMCGVVEGFYGRPWTTSQRKELFQRMKKMGLNTYLYAPKDDSKHRAYWRELYSVEEADHLTGLIEAATECNVIFVYALSPGLDMTFSNSKEITFLKKKLEQVSAFGCKAFALLFDDIEPELCEADKQMFQSFAHAQVSVTNEVYQHLNQPKFLYCPTEYCASRAVPNVETSDYLNTIGSKLLPDIDIMWTGPKVISKKITVESIEELTKVLNRPPVIWDNIHANDYDQKRLFLGPYIGRSAALIPYLRGVLTNPNCEFEANYIALHTLAQWSKSSKGLRKDVIPSERSVVASDIKLETEGDMYSQDDDTSVLDGYSPKEALKLAIIDWLQEFYRKNTNFARGKVLISTAGAPTPDSVVAPPSLVPPIITCMTMTPTTTTMSQQHNIIPLTGITNANQLQQLGDVQDSYIQPITKEIVNSLVDANSVIGVTTVSSPPEPMDADPELILSQTNTTDEMDIKLTCLDVDSNNKIDAEKMQVDSACDSSEVVCKEKLDLNDISLLVDLFYLPFAHGSEAVKLLTEFHWLKTNSHHAAPRKAKKTSTPEAVEWQERAKAFGDLVKWVTDMIEKLFHIPNRDLLYDLYPYVWDLRGVLGLLHSFVKWLANGIVPYVSIIRLAGNLSWATKGYKDTFMSGDQEPWVFRGGLTGEFQRMLPIDGAHDLFNSKVPDIPCSKVFTVRPYLATDEAAVYDVCVKTCDDGCDGSDIFAPLSEVIGDRLVGGFLNTSPEYCFVVEDDDGVCGYVLAAPDSKTYYKKLEIAWMSAMCSKYQKPNKEDNLTPVEEIIAGFHNFDPYLPESLYRRHPSLLSLSILPDRVDDAMIPKRMMACALSALKANGSHGVYVEIQVGDKYVVDLYGRLGFLEIPSLETISEEITVLGRAI